MFLHDLNQISWDSTDDDIDKLFSSFFSKLNRVINKHAPIKIASTKKVKQLLKLITKGILKSIHLKDRFFSLAKLKNINFIKININTYQNK